MQEPPDCGVVAQLRATKRRTPRDWASRLRNTPLHPQWLIGRRVPPPGLAEIRGLVLDIGSADRWIVPYLAPAARYVALDYPITERSFYDTRPDVYADARFLPVADGCADGIVCLEVIEHVADAGQAVMEIARVLKPGARAWLSMPFLYPLHNAPFDFQRYTEFGLRRDVARAGLEVETLDRTHHAVHTATVLGCLTLAGGVANARGIRRWGLLPIAAIAVFFLNLAGALLSRFWPDWPNASIGHAVVLRKPLDTCG